MIVCHAVRMDGTEPKGWRRLIHFFVAGVFTKKWSEEECSIDLDIILRVFVLDSSALSSFFLGAAPGAISEIR